MSSLRSDTPDPDDPDSASGTFVMSVLYSLILTCRVKYDFSLRYRSLSGIHCIILSVINTLCSNRNSANII